MCHPSIEIRPARQADAAAIAGLVMMAMSEESCRIICGAAHPLSDFRLMLTDLARRDDSQYSYRNTLGAYAAGRLVGIAVSYDGAQLHALRRAFVYAARRQLGQDYSQIPDETQPGELYLDSFAVLPDFRRRGIGRRLLEATRRRAVQLRLPRVGLLVDKGNPTAERLYTAVGFRWADDTEWFGHPMKHLTLAVER